VKVNEIEKSNELNKAQEILIEESLIDKKAMTQIINNVKSQNTSVADKEVDSLLKLANKELFKDKLKKETSKTVDASSLLLEVEDEMGQSFRTKVYEALTVQGQETKKDSIESGETLKQKRIENLLKKKTSIENQEKKYLKAEIEIINKRLDNKEISAEEAEVLKKEAARKRASNIEDRLAIIDKRIELIRRNPYQENLEDYDDETVAISIGPKGLFIDLEKGESKPPKYDIRTANRLIFAMGFNNAIGDGQSLDDSPFKLAGSGFVELGWEWQTRLFKNSNFVRLNYGLSFQWNKLNIKNDQYFVDNGDQTTLETFPLEVKKVKFRTSNLVVPVHFEFGPSRKKDYGNKIRFFTDNHFRIGIGGYGGVRLRSQQKIVYEDEEGDRVKDKQKRSFNGSNFVYGISGYIGWGDLSIYAKYDLSPLFKDQPFEQNNISLGVRLDLD